MSIQQLTEGLSTGRLRLTRMDDGSAVLLDGEGEALFSLNATARFLIEQVLGGSTELDELAHALSSEFSISIEAAREDTQGFIEALTATL